MKHNHLCLGGLLWLVAGLGLALNAGAAGRGKSGRDYPSHTVEVTVDTHKFTGVIASIDPAHRTLVVNGQEIYETKTRKVYGSDPKSKPSADSKKTLEGQVTFKIQPGCTVTLDKKPRATLADLKAGDTVTVSHVTDAKNSLIESALIATDITTATKARTPAGKTRDKPE